MSVIKRGDFLMGIRYWAQWYTHMTPQYEVFKYIGTNQDTGISYFESIKNKGAIIGRSFYQLNVNGFHPFVLDHNRIQAYLATKGTN
jgi:hypothetical protein